MRREPGRAPAGPIIPALWALVLGAWPCHAQAASAPVAAGAATPAPATAADRPWLEGLRKEAGGQSIILARAADGMIFGRSLDGTVRRDLVRSDARFPLLDGGLELLWLHEGTKVDVVDLRARTPKRIPIVKDTIADTSFKVMRSLDDDKDTSLMRDGACSEQLMTLSWDMSMVEVYGSDAEVLSDVTPRLVGKSWLKANAHRKGAVQPESLLMWESGQPSTVALPPALDRCYRAPASQNSSCKRWMDFGFKGWQLLVTTGARPTKTDGCVQYACLLHDPKAKTFASPEDPTRWGAADAVASAPCRAFLFDASGRRYLTKTKLCDLNDGCKDLGGESIGWLPFGPRIQTAF